MYVSLYTGSHLLTTFSVHNKPKVKKTALMKTKLHSGINSQAQCTTALTTSVFLTGIYIYIYISGADRKDLRI